MSIEALGAELTVQAFDEGVICRLAGPAEVECHVVHERPKVEFLADELRAVVEANGLWVCEAE